MKEAAVDGKYIIDGKHVCGAAFCTFCNEHNLCEGSQFCPTHNKDSTLYEESNFSTFSPAITTPSRTLYTTPASSNSNVDNCATPTNMSGGAPAKSLSTKSNQPLSLQKLMRVAAQDENMFVSKKDFLDGLNETFTESKSARVARGHFRVPDNPKMSMKKIRTNVKTVLDMFKLKKDIMTIPSKNQSKQENDLCTYIYKQSRANSRLRKEMNAQSHPEVWELVKDLPPDRKIYLFSQSGVLDYAIRRWGKTMEAATKEPTPGDFCRYIGILLHTDNRDLLDALQKTKPTEKKDGRKFHDDPAFKPVNIFDNLLDQYLDPTVIVKMPKEWVTMTSVDGYIEMNPNNYERIGFDWKAEDMMSMDSICRTFYKGVMKYWAKGTGGGPGEDEGYTDWMKRCPKKIWTNNYCANAGAPFYVVFIYLLDRAQSFVFETTYEGLNPDASAEGGITEEEKNTAPQLKPTNYQESDISAKIDGFIQTATATMASVTSSMAQDNTENNAAEKLRDQRTKCLRDIREVNEHLKEARDNVRKYGGKDVSKKKKRRIHQYKSDVTVFEKTHRSCMNTLAVINKKLEKLDVPCSDGEQGSSSSDDSEDLNESDCEPKESR